MAATDQPAKGTRVTITADHLGVLNYPGGGFHPDVILNRGDEATYVEPMLDDNWHRLTLERDGQTYTCPAHASQFEVA